jgi:SH3 domain
MKRRPRNAKRTKRVSTDARNICTVSSKDSINDGHFLKQNLLLLLAGIQEKLGILNNGEVFAVFSYDANQSDEVGFTVNDKLTILRKGDESEREWWWARDMNEREGYVPRNLLGVSIIKIIWLSM